MCPTSFSILVLYWMLQVEQIVDIGELDPECIHIPNIFVDRVVVGKFEKRIEVNCRFTLMLFTIDESCSF